VRFSDGFFHNRRLTYESEALCWFLAIILQLKGFLMLSIVLIAVMGLASMSYVSCGETAQKSTQNSSSQETGQWPDERCATLNAIIGRAGKDPHSYSAADSFKEFAIAVDDLAIDPTTCNRNGYTLMHTAALYDRYSAGIPLTLAFLTKIGKMDVNAQAKPTGSTPLHIATLIGNDHTVDFLLENGANPLIKNHLGTAYENAKRFSRFAKSQELCKNFDRTIEKLEKAENLARFKKELYNS
jgi:hypothetical protein